MATTYFTANPEKWVEKARNYVNKIRNQGKRMYAAAFLGYLQGKRSEPNEKQYGISTMAAQAVRLELYDLQRTAQNPLRHFRCRICKAAVPERLLAHSKFEERMSWLRRHYREKHPVEFRRMYERNPLEYKRAPWQMTRAEFVQQEIKSKRHKGNKFYTPDVIKALHYDLLRTALDDGKPVSAEVLQDYPDLAKKYPAIPKVELSMIRKNPFWEPLTMGLGFGTGLTLAGMTLKRMVEKNPPIAGKLPLVAIGQFSPQEKKDLDKMVRAGTAIKYIDYTFPMTKTGYALATHKLPPPKQMIKESLRSLKEGVWVVVPESYKRVEKRLLSELKTANPIQGVCPRCGRRNPLVAREFTCAGCGTALRVRR